MDKKIRCSRCGGEHLQFVNVPYSVKGKCDILFIFETIFYIFGIALLIVGFTLDLNKNHKILEYLFLNDIFIISGIIFIAEAIKLTITKYFIPYKNNNIIKYVCSECGNVENLDDIALKDIECVPSKEESTGS